MPGSKGSRGGQTASIASKYSKAHMQNLLSTAIRETTAAWGKDVLDGIEIQWYLQQPEYQKLVKELGMSPTSDAFKEFLLTLDEWNGSSVSFRYTDGNKESIAQRAVLDYLADTGGYQGELYRGLHFEDMTPQEGAQWIKKVIRKGVWKEPGPASFSTSKGTAIEFATEEGDFTSGKGTRVLLHVKNATNGRDINYRHTYQKEVLQSSNRGAKGWNIIGHSTMVVDGETVYVLSLEER